MKKIKIYVVDDEIFYADIIADFLKIKKYDKPKTFPTAEMMLDELYMKPDIVILDINLPGMSGITALKKIKEFDPDIYVIMLSSQEDIVTAVNTLKHGAFDYIIKDEKAFGKLLEVLEKVKHVELLKENMYFSLLGKVKLTKRHYVFH